MEYCEDHEIPAIILSIDFEKAYDSVEWPIIDFALGFFNFGSNIRQWVKILYKNLKSCVTNNGYKTNFFTIERGIRQGCPLSSFLFIITIELLAILIRSH